MSDYIVIDKENNIFFNFSILLFKIDHFLCVLIFAPIYLVLLLAYVGYAFIVISGSFLHKQIKKNKYRSRLNREAILKCSGETHFYIFYKFACRILM